MNGRTSRRQMLVAGTAGAIGLASAGIVPADGAPAQSSMTNDPRSRLLSMIEGYRLSQMIHVAAKLRIADHLKKGPRTVRELAKLTRSDEDSLYRLLRTLAGYGVFREERGPSFRLTRLADLLRTDASGSLCVAAEVAGADWMWRPWGHLMYSIQTGEIAFDHLYGQNTWDWFAKNPGPAELFNAFMDENTGIETRAVVSSYDFSKAKTIVDVAGGRGVLLAAVLESNPAARGTLFELPHVIESARKTLTGNISRRITFVAGDFFKSVPPGGDLYLLKNVVHDWNDSQARNILSVLHAAMKGKGILILVEFVVCGPNTLCPGKTRDMLMMVRNGGRNRTEKEYRELLVAAGFNITRVIPSRGGGPHLFEASPTG
jgi:hypothetical protein